jgi:hypothetical protein
MLLLTTPAAVTDLQSPLAYWGPATRSHTPRTAHPPRIASGRTPLQVAAEARLGATWPRLHSSGTDASRGTAGPLSQQRAA